MNYGDTVIRRAPREGDAPRNTREKKKKRIESYIFNEERLRLASSNVLEMVRSMEL